MDHFPTATRPRRIRLRPLAVTRPTAAAGPALAAPPEILGEPGEDPHSPSPSPLPTAAAAEPPDPIGQTLALLSGGIIGLLALVVPLAAVLLEPSASPALPRGGEQVRPTSAAGTPRSPAPGTPAPDPRIPPR